MFFRPLDILKFERHAHPRRFPEVRLFRFRRPRKIILVRHGESERQLDESILSHKPDWKIDLTDRGRAQAFEIGKLLRQHCSLRDNIRFWISPFYRTRQTYQEIAKSFSGMRYHVFEESRLREQDWGNLQPSDAMPIIKKERSEYGHFFYRIPNGESGADVFDRLSTFFETMWRSFSAPNPPTVVIIVTHGLLARLFLMRWYHLSVEQFEHIMNLDNCQAIVMERRRDGRYELTTPLNVWREDHGGLTAAGGTPSFDHRRALLPGRLKAQLADHPQVEEDLGPSDVHLRSFVDTVQDLLLGHKAEAVRLHEDADPGADHVVKEDRDLLRTLFDMDRSLASQVSRQGRPVKACRIGTRSDVLRAGRRRREQVAAEEVAAPGDEEVASSTRLPF